MDIVDLAQLETSTKYIQESDLLFGKIVPKLFINEEKAIGLSMDPVTQYVETNNLLEDSLETLQIKDDYLLDAQNIIKHAKSQLER